MTDIGVLLRTYLEPFQWLGLGSGGAIPRWNASRLEESYRRSRNELERFFSIAGRLFKRFLCAVPSLPPKMRTGAAPAGDTLQDTAPAHPPLTRNATRRAARLLQIVEQRESLHLDVRGLRGLESRHLQVQLAHRACVVGVL